MGGRPEERKVRCLWQRSGGEEFVARGLVAAGGCVRGGWGGGGGGEAGHDGSGNRWWPVLGRADAVHAAGAVGDGHAGVSGGVRAVRPDRVAREAPAAG